MNDRHARPVAAKTWHAPPRDDLIGYNITTSRISGVPFRVPEAAAWTRRPKFYQSKDTYMGAEMISLLYCSRARADDAETAGPVIGDILRAARANNSRDGLTGALLCTAGKFAQILEGPAEAVERTFAQVRLDPRHHDVVVLAKSVIQERDFANWSMALSIDGPVGQQLAPAVFRRAFAEQGEPVALEVASLIKKGIADVQIW